MGWIDDLADQGIGGSRSEKTSKDPASTDNNIDNAHSDVGLGDKTVSDDVTSEAPIQLPSRKKDRKLPAYLDKRTYSTDTDTEDAADTVEQAPKPTTRVKTDKPKKVRKPGSTHAPHLASGSTTGRAGLLSGVRGGVVGIAALSLALVVAGVFGVRAMSGTEAVTARDTGQSSVAPVPSPTEHRDLLPDPDGAGPAANEKSIGGTCSTVEDSELPVMRANQRDIRGAWVTYNSELYAHNAEGIEAVLSGDSSMRDQDWPAVFDQVDKGATFCLEMDTVSGKQVRGHLTVTTADGETTDYYQKATGVEVDGRWFVKDITQDSTRGTRA